MQFILHGPNSCAYICKSYENNFAKLQASEHSIPHKSSHVEPRNTTETVISSSEKIKNYPKILIHCEALESTLEGSSEICFQDQARQNLKPVFSRPHSTDNSETLR